MWRRRRFEREPEDRQREERALGDVVTFGLRLQHETSLLEEVAEGRDAVAELQENFLDIQGREERPRLRRHAASGPIRSAGGPLECLVLLGRIGDDEQHACSLERSAR